MNFNSVMAPLPRSLFFFFFKLLFSIKSLRSPTCIAFCPCFCLHWSNFYLHCLAALGLAVPTIPVSSILGSDLELSAG